MNDRNQLATIELHIPSLAMAEEELVKVLQVSVYPGAAMESIKLVIGYCRAQNLDPLQKPVHIVPMDVKVKKEHGSGFDYVKRDVIMPGIGLYRVQATRSGLHAGTSEPSFGATKSLKFKQKKWVDNGDGGRSERWIDGETEYPESCTVVVKRLVGDRLVEFPATERWLENYATAGRDSDAPNAMWQKRPFAQLAKCAEAQALRKAFPEFGAQATAEEMEGKTFDEPIDVQPMKPPVQLPQERATTLPAPDAGEAPKAREGEHIPAAKADLGVDSSPPAKPSQIKLIVTKAEQATITVGEIIKKFGLKEKDTAGVEATTLDSITTEQGNLILAWLRNPGDQA